MTFRRASRPQPLFVALLALGAALMLALAMAPAPAYAHDTLLSSDPEDGATLETSPEAITLTFSADVLDVSPIVRITDESDETLAEITPSVDGPTATATLEEPLPAGTHDVQWRVVSGDGHPIEGTFTITVEHGSDEATGTSDGGGAEASDSGGAEMSDAGGAEASDTGGQDETPADTTAAEEEGSAMPLLLGIVGVVVLGVAVAAFFTLRKRS